MIIYFSATGNSQYVSKKIAKEINEKTYSIIENKNTRKYHIHIEKDETLVLLFQHTSGDYQQL